MIHIFQRHRDPVIWLKDRSSADTTLPLSVTVPFFCGLLLGCVIGAFSERIPSFLSALPLLSESASFDGFGGSVWLSCRYFFFAFLLSSSLLGAALMPCLVFLRGFSFACEAAASFAAYRYDGLTFAVLRIGIPALLELPAFVVFATAGIRFSRYLFSAVGKRSLRAGTDPPLLKPLVFVFPLLLISILYRNFLLPALLIKLF